MKINGFKPGGLKAHEGHKGHEGHEGQDARIWNKHTNNLTSLLTRNMFCMSLGTRASCIPPPYPLIYIHTNFIYDVLYTILCTIYYILHSLLFCCVTGLLFLKHRFELGSTERASRRLAIRILDFLSNKLHDVVAWTHGCWELVACPDALEIFLEPWRLRCMWTCDLRRHIFLNRHALGGKPSLSMTVEEVACGAEVGSSKIIHIKILGIPMWPN